MNHTALHFAGTIENNVENIMCLLAARADLSIQDNVSVSNNNYID